MTAVHGNTTEQGSAAGLATLLVELRSALASGAACAPALIAAHARHPQVLPELAVALRALALGASIGQAAEMVGDSDAVGATLLRALAVAELAGAGASEAVEQSEAWLREQLALERALRVHTAQSRSSMRVLTLAPLSVAALFVALQPDALGFYRLRIGQVLVLLAAVLWWSARRWSSAIVAAVPQAAAAADPLAQATGGADEVAELLAVALRAGLSPLAAVALVARLGPPSARPALDLVQRGLAAGLSPQSAFAQTPLHSLGAVVAGPLQWGGPADAALRGWAACLRADRSAALQEAAARAEVRLVFPTTLLTLPSFLLGVVPPMVWTGLRP